MSEPDRRRVMRIVVDVLLEPHQREGLMTALGRALCDGPGDHPGPCRVAWSLSYADEGESDLDEAPYGLGRDEVAFVRAHLAPVPVWDRDDVTRSLPPDE